MTYRVITNVHSGEAGHSSTCTDCCSLEDQALFNLVCFLFSLRCRLAPLVVAV